MPGPAIAKVIFPRLRGYAVGVMVMHSEGDLPSTKVNVRVMLRFELGLLGICSRGSGYA